MVTDESLSGKPLLKVIMMKEIFTLIGIAIAFFGLRGLYFSFKAVSNPKPGQTPNIFDAQSFTEIGKQYHKRYLQYVTLLLILFFVLFFLVTLEKFVLNH